MILTDIMSFDCKYKAKDYQCLKLNRECSPGIKGCVLYGKYVFAFQEEESENSKDKKNDRKIK